MLPNFPPGDDVRRERKVLKENLFNERILNESILNLRMNQRSSPKSSTRFGERESLREKPKERSVREDQKDQLQMFILDDFNRRMNRDALRFQPS